MDIKVVYNVVQRDTYFLVSVDLNENTANKSSAVDYLDRYSYVT